VRYVYQSIGSQVSAQREVDRPRVGHQTVTAFALLEQSSVRHVCILIYRRVIAMSQVLFGVVRQCDSGLPMHTR
jgi:hypothetical protein